MVGKLYTTESIFEITFVYKENVFNISMIEHHH